MTPTIGSRISAVRRGNLEHVAEREMLQLRQVVGRPSALRRPRRADTCRRRCRRPARAAPSRAMLSTSTATTITGVLRNMMRASRTICTRAHAGNRRQLRPHRRRKPDRADDDALRRHDEELGVERRFHPVDDRVVAGAGHAGERDDQRQRQHQRGDARRGAARRLNQAVGGQRAFDRPQPTSGSGAAPSRARATAAG